MDKDFKMVVLTVFIFLWPN